MIQKKSIPFNGIAVDQAAILSSPRGRGSQTGSHGSIARSSNPGRRWGLHLVRRNRVFYFRRRWPQSLRDVGAPEFLSVSLRTEILSDAVKRSADLLTLIEAGEREVTAELTTAPASEWRIKVMIREMVRESVATMLARLEAPFDAAESRAYLAKCEEKRQGVDTALRLRDWPSAANLGASAASLVGLGEDALAAPAIAREVLIKTRSLLDLALQVEDSCDDPLTAGSHLLENVGLAPKRKSLLPPMTMVEAIEKAA